MAQRPSRSCPSIYGGSQAAPQASKQSTQKRKTKGASSVSKSAQKAATVESQPHPTPSSALMDSLDTQPGSSLARLQQHLGTQQTLSTAGAREWTPGASLPPRHSLPPSTSTAPNRFATTATIPEEDIAIDPALDALAPVERNLEPVGRSGLGSESSAGGGGPAVKITRPKAKDGEGKRAAKHRETLKNYKREPDLAKAKRGYRRAIPALQKAFLRATKVFGGEGVLLIGHPSILKQRRQLDLNGRKSNLANSQGIARYRFASNAFRSRNKEVLTSKLGFGEGSIPFRKAEEAPSQVTFKSILNSMEDLFEVGLGELQSDGGEAIRKLHQQFEEEMTVRQRSAEKAMRKDLGSMKLSQEQIDQVVANARAAYEVNSEKEKRAKQGIESDDEEILSDGEGEDESEKEEEEGNEGNGGQVE